MTDTVVARVAALKSMPISDLKQQWRALFDSDPPPFNRRYLESRLAYRIQELAYGGLKAETVERLKALADDLDDDRSKVQRSRTTNRPIAGTQLVRERLVVASRHAHRRPDHHDRLGRRGRLGVHVQGEPIVAAVQGFRRTRFGHAPQRTR